MIHNTNVALVQATGIPVIQAEPITITQDVERVVALTELDSNEDTSENTSQQYYEHPLSNLMIRCSIHGIMLVFIVMTTYIMFAIIALADISPRSVRYKCKGSGLWGYVCMTMLIIPAFNIVLWQRKRVEYKVFCAVSGIVSVINLFFFIMGINELSVSCVDLLQDTRIYTMAVVSMYMTGINMLGYGSIVLLYLFTE